MARVKCDASSGRAKGKAERDRPVTLRTRATLARMSLVRWFQRKRDRLLLVLYTRRNCPLCDELKQLVERSRHSSAVSLEMVDVDLDPQTNERYGWRVPVLTAADEVVVEGRVEAKLLDERLATVLQAFDESSAGASDA